MPYIVRLSLMRRLVMWLIERLCDHEVEYCNVHTYVKQKQQCTNYFEDREAARSVFFLQNSGLQIQLPKRTSLVKVNDRMTLDGNLYRMAQKYAK